MESGTNTSTPVGMPVKVDVTSTDPYEVARLWGVEVTTTTGGLLALPVKEHCFARQHDGYGEEGRPGDVLMVRNQTMQRRIIPGDLFTFIFGEKLS